MPTIVPAESVSSLTSRSLGDPFLEIAWLSTVTLEQYERLIERDDSFAHYVLVWLNGWFCRKAKALQSEENCLQEISIDNFMKKLETGITLCRLAELIVTQSRNSGRPILNKCVPTFNFKPWMNAKPRSFYARDNVENFTRWCRRFGVNESVLFESDGLVMHQAPRYVLLVLLELCRLCARRGIDSPGVHEKRQQQRQLQLDEEERILKCQREREAQLKQQQQERQNEEEILAEAERIRNENELQKFEQSTRIDELRIAEERRKPVEEAVLQQRNELLNRSENQQKHEEADPDLKTPVCFAMSVLQPFDDEGHLTSIGNKLKNTKSRLPVPNRNNKAEFSLTKLTSVLDQKVNTIVNNVLKGAKLHRLSEGKYLINGRTCLVRLLNDKQVMVRVGGGWKSLEEILKPRVIRTKQGFIQSERMSDAKSQESTENIRKALTGSLASITSSMSSSSQRSQIPVGNRSC